MAGTRHRDRDRQFRYLVRLRQAVPDTGMARDQRGYQEEGVGRRLQEPGPDAGGEDRGGARPRLPELGRSGGRSPTASMTWPATMGYVVVGTSHETPSFAVAAIRRWWLEVGRWRYSGSEAVADRGGRGRGQRPPKWEWKVALQALADEFGLIITVTHYPPGASKWNPIDHRMFSLISGNWAGEPLISYETILKFIRSTRSSGFPLPGVSGPEAVRGPTPSLARGKGAACGWCPEGSASVELHDQAAYAPSKRVKLSLSVALARCL